MTSAMDNGVSDLGYNLRWKDHRNEVFSELHRLRSNSALSDVTVFCPGEPSSFSNQNVSGKSGELFRSHKVVLASCSVVFENLLVSLSSIHGDVPTNNTVLVLTDVDSSTFRLILNFIYAGEIFLETV